jgi:uncharacterized membrane protein YedE/YeeE
MKNFLALVCGTTFGVGLAVSGMTNPAKVLAFLDVAGNWDATLAFVMGGAMMVSAAAVVLARRRGSTLLGDSLALPTHRDLDPSLLAGASMFGVGWGLIGLCPGPALAGLSRGNVELFVFVAAMVVGVVGYRVTKRIMGQGSNDPAGNVRGTIAN